jgi:UDP-N-acetylmuramoyl-tripeptide--D-alanyl-D-alanine ligase
MLTLAEVLAATGGALVGTPPGGGALRFSRVVVDSRAVTPDCLFVALRGERADGHTFVEQALANGAAGALVEYLPEVAGGQAWPLVVVSSTPAALAAMARSALDRYPGLTVVGITGSLGKTTTKEVVAGVLSTQRQVFKSEGNLNSEIGLPMTVLNGLSATTRAEPYEIAVLEMAMYQVGDIRLLARLARPRLGVVTSVLPIHLERIGTIERIQQAKQELVEELPSDGVAVLNADDPRVAQMAEATAARVVRYGVAESADVRAERILSRGLDGVEFDVLHSGQRRPVHLPLLGTHSVYAALAATSVALEQGFSLVEAADALQALSPTLRLLVVDGVHGSRIIDDSYNASPESVLAALNLLHELPGKRKIGVLGDMLELGSEEESSHLRIGARAANVLDLLIVYGPRSKVTADEARRRGLAQVFEAETHDDIIQRLRSGLGPGDDVLVKGSLAMGMSAVVQGIRAKVGQ